LQKLKLTSYDAPPEAWTASVDTEGSCWSEWPILFVKRLLPEEQIVPPVFHSQHYRVHLLFVRGRVLDGCIEHLTGGLNRLIVYSVRFLL